MFPIRLGVAPKNGELATDPTNDSVAWGYWLYNKDAHEIAGMPATYGSIFKSPKRLYSQYITFISSGGSAYVKSFWGSGWSSWQRIDNFGCNTLAELKAALANV